MKLPAHILAGRKQHQMVHADLTAGRAVLFPQPVTQSIPRKDWPLWAKVLANRSRTEDKGIGDVAARMIGAETSAAFKAWFKVTFGKDCGCNGRQKLWNIKYPLNLKAS